MIRRVLCICLSGIALISASRVADAAPPPATAASAAPSAPAAPAPDSAPPAPAAAPAHPAATPPAPAPYPYPYGYPSGYWREAPPAPTLEASASTKRYWYGWQTLLVFGTSGVLMATAPAAAPVTVPLSLGGFVLGGPVVHWANGNVSKGFISLGVNLGGTLLGGLTAGVACSELCKDSREGLAALGATVVGAGVGLLIANILDVAVFSYGQRKPVYHDAAARRRPSITWLPTFDARQGRASVGLVGTF
jgi:hypothetical protein